jgi:hypothetical protein
LDFYLNVKTRLIYSSDDLEKTPDKEIFLVTSKSVGVAGEKSKFRIEAERFFDDTRVLKMIER